VKRQRVFPGWRVVAGSALGIGFSAQVFIATGYTILAAALGNAFGWSLAELAPGATLFLLGQMVGFPLMGLLLDRFGTRGVAVAGIAVFGLMLLVLSRITAVWQLYALMLVTGLTGPATYTLPYLRALSLWFSRRRGLAIGLAAGGIALGAATIPLALQKISALHGWSVALVTFALFELLVCLPLVALLVRDDPARFGLGPDGDAVPVPRGEAGVTRFVSPADDGLSAAEALRTADFWLLGGAYLVAGLAVYGVITNAVHILSQTGAGLTTEQVAMTQAVGGVAVLFGRIAGGYALDRLGTRAIAVFMMLLIAVAIYGYAVSTSLGMVLVSAVLLGLATGGEGDVLPFMVVKYFGARAFGKIYGMLGGIFSAGTALGPVTYAGLAAGTGSPSTPLLIFSIATAVAAFAFAAVGRRTGP
jgi:sugar phosphate permease